MSNLGGFHVILKWQLGESIDDGQGYAACLRTGAYERAGVRMKDIFDVRRSTIRRLKKGRLFIMAERIVMIQAQKSRGG